MKDKFIIWWAMLIPRFRVYFGACPLCNSDAPELDNCPLCEGYHSAKGDPYPPSEEIKKAWLEEMLSVKRIQLNIKKIVRDARAKRLKEKKRLIKEEA